MTKFTASENATRKNVFKTIRDKQYLTVSDLKRKFGRSKVVLQAISEARQRIANGKPMPVEVCMFFDKLKKNAIACARCLPDEGHSMGEYKRITNRLYGAFGLGNKYSPNVIADCDNTREYRGGSWRAAHGEVSVELPISVLAKAEVMEGMITLRGKQVQKRIWKCQWVVWDYERNKRGFITTNTIGYHLESGYVVATHKVMVGVTWTQAWYHCKSLNEARTHLTNSIALEKDIAKRRKEEKKRAAEQEKEAKRRQREQEKAERNERKAVMAHGKKYTQREVSRAAWVIFGKIASRQESYLYRFVCYGEYRLNIDREDAFERDVDATFRTICKEHDVVKERSKHDSRVKQAKYKAVKHSAELQDGLQHMYVYSDSIEAGNCVPGTDGFIADHGLQKTDTRSGEFLLRISKGSRQHRNVRLIIEYYMSKTHADFYQQNYQVIDNVLSNIQ